MKQQFNSSWGIAQRPQTTAPKTNTFVRPDISKVTHEEIKPISSKALAELMADQVEIAPCGCF